MTTLLVWVPLAISGPQLSSSHLYLFRFLFFSLHPILFLEFLESLPMRGRADGDLRCGVLRAAGLGEVRAVRLGELGRGLGRAPRRRPRRAPRHRDEGS
jgi:hypothetical protein